jgi:hypothetical protein
LLPPPPLFILLWPSVIVVPRYGQYNTDIILLGFYCCVFNTSCIPVIKECDFRILIIVANIYRRVCLRFPLTTVNFFSIMSLCLTRCTKRLPLTLQLNRRNCLRMIQCRVYFLLSGKAAVIPCVRNVR